MNGMLNMLKALGIDPEALQQQAKDVYERFAGLEKTVTVDVDNRLTQAEAEIARLKEHFGLHDAEAEQAPSLPAPVAVLPAPVPEPAKAE